MVAAILDFLLTKNVNLEWIAQKLFMHILGSIKINVFDKTK